MSLPSSTHQRSLRRRPSSLTRPFTLLLLLAATSPLDSTTLVVKLDNGRILLAADTREERFNPGTVALVRSPGNDQRCKIRSLGGIGFAVTGFVEYRGGDVAQKLADWNANSDATDAFAAAGDNIRQLAANWSQRTSAHFARLYAMNPDWLKQLAGINQQGLLQVAFFAGWDKDEPIFLIEIVSFDPAAPTGIQVREQIQPVGEAPFSTNAITQELISGETDRAQHIADTWDTLAETIRTEDLGWKHIEFYIQQTAALDSDVSATADVLAIPARKSATWLKNSACGETQP